MMAAQRKQFEFLKLSFMLRQDKQLFIEKCHKLRRDFRNLKLLSILYKQTVVTSAPLRGHCKDIAFPSAATFKLLFSRSEET